MDPIDVPLVVFQGFGLLYLVGGMFAVRQAWIMRGLDASIRAIESVVGEPRSPPAYDDGERGRYWWLTLGGLLTSVAGAAMALRSSWATWLLATLVLHQVLYFARQRRYELRAPTPEAAEQARPAPSTRNAAFFAMGLAVAAAAFDYFGKLR